MPIDHVLAAVAVADLEASKLWYERLFGRPADETPMAEAAEWRLSDSGWLQLVRDPDRAGRSIVTLSVTDMDGFAAELNRHDVAFNATPSGQGAFRIAQLSDPDGNVITFAQDQRPDADRRSGRLDPGGAPKQPWIDGP